MSKMTPKQCVRCGTVYTPRSWNSTMIPLCSPACKAAHHEAKRKVVNLPCVTCGEIVECKGRRGLEMARKGRVYCSETCKTAYLKKISSETMTATNRKYASQRMKTNNPMTDPQAKAKMQKKLKARGWGTGQRGGNGELTIPQKKLAAALGWETEVAIPTGQPRGSGYPASYKVDIGNPTLKIAIEVDGVSHKLPARRLEDQKKTALLEALGWTVLRFWNAEIMADVSLCVRTVLSITWKSSTNIPT